jgi:hypothetical protein
MSEGVRDNNDPLPFFPPKDIMMTVEIAKNRPKPVEVS